METDNFWVRTSDRHVWYNTMTKKYTFSDETENFNGEYETQTDAYYAMMDYCENL